ncbi:MAG: acetate uptake transporter [Thaumarchaeota archaeon]|nr:acetate uptake transporter [Nitrososphaerota archaeon]
MSEKSEWASPAALGLAGFGLTTVLLNLHNAGFIETPTLTFSFGFFYGGLIQIFAGLIDGKRGDIFGLTAFTSYGGFWIALSLAMLLNRLGVAEISPVELGFAMFLWGLFTLYLTIGSFKVSKFAVPLVFVTLTILFFLLATGFFVLASTGSPIVIRIAGLEGILCGLSAMYASAAIVLNTHLEKQVLPL